MLDKTHTEKTSTMKKVAIATGVTGLLAAATLGAHFLFNTKKGKQSLKHMRSWAFRMKSELLDRLEKAKEVNKDVYDRVVDELATKYQKVKGMTVAEVTEIAQELKGQWKYVQGEIKKTLNSGNHAKSKSKPKPNSAAKKTVKAVKSATKK